MTKAAVDYIIKSKTPNKQQQVASKMKENDYMGINYRTTAYGQL